MGPVGSGAADATGQIWMMETVASVVDIGDGLHVLCGEVVVVGESSLPATVGIVINNLKKAGCCSIGKQGNVGEGQAQ